MSGALNYGELVRDTEVTVRSSGPLPEGKYTAEIKESELKVTANGKPKFAVTFVIVEGEEAGRKVFNDIVLPTGDKDEKSVAANRIFLGKLYALGLSKQWLGTNPSNEEVAKALVGKWADIVTYVDSTYNPEKPKAKVRYINPPSKRPAQVGPQVGFSPAPAPSGPAFPPARPSAPAAAPVGFNAGPVISALNANKVTPPPAPAAEETAPAVVEEPASEGNPTPVEF